MKSIKFLTGAAVSLALLAACEVEYPVVDILPDTIFEQSGMQDKETVSIYDTDKLVFNIVRTAGLSKTVDMQIQIDPQLLEEYNMLNNTNYELLSPSYYELPTAVELKAQTKNIQVVGSIRPSAMVQAEGLAAANNKILPIRIGNSSQEVEDQGSQMTVLLHPVVVDPLITPTVPRDAAQLEFVSIVPIAQTYTLVAKTNFNSVDLSQVHFEIDESKVAEYNAAHETDYVPLPSSYFKMGTVNDGTFVFDSENYTLNNTVTFDCYQIDGENTYLAPFVLKADGGYDVTTSAPVYVIVSKKNLIVSIRNASQNVNTTTGKGSIEIRLSTELADPQTVKVKYDKALIDAYNEEHETSYKTLDDVRLTFTEATFEPGETTAALTFEVEASDFAYESDKYLIPISIDIESMPEGTEIQENFGTRFVIFQKSLEGNYTKTVWGQEYTSGSARRLKPVIYREGSGCPAINRNYPENAMLTYAINYNDTWADGLIYFYISDDNFNGDPTKKVLKGFKDRPNAQSGKGYDEIKDEGRSYFDTVNESFHFDITVMDGYWSSQGGFPIQADLTNHKDL